MVVDTKAIARAIKLRYVTDTRPGIIRRAVDEGFEYLDVQGNVINDESELERIKAIGIPPAWTDVWISPYANGYILATGRDEKGRKQYRYHPKWNEHRSLTKFDKLAAFGQALPLIRQTVEQHLRQNKLTREKVLAIVVCLLETTLIRIGNPEYARTNESYGLTTMHDDHVKITGSKIHFQFRGKSGKDHEIDVQDKRLAKLVKASRDIPGQDLFQYYDENRTPHPVGSGDVNDYLREITGEDFSAKDFRTWGGSVLAVEAMCTLPECQTETEGKKAVAQAVKSVAEGLGNTPTICRKYYIHPAVIDAYMNGTLQKLLAETGKEPLPDGLTLPEATLMKLISGGS
jgi:DNA topoisomerase I